MNFTLPFRYLKKWRTLKCFDVLYIFVCLIIYTSNTQSLCESVPADISLHNCRVYGPGLNANFTVPVRYFFIQLIDTKNER